eukprot:6206267-Pleurochrysis_carterae.AAC.1
MAVRAMRAQHVSLRLHFCRPEALRARLTHGSRLVQSIDRTYAISLRNMTELGTLVRNKSHRNLALAFYGHRRCLCALATCRYQRHDGGACTRDF